MAYRWVCFELGKLAMYKLRVIDDKHAIELTIIPKTPAKKFEALSKFQMLVDLVKNFVDQLMKELMPATLEVNPVKCCLPCPRCSNPECIEIEAAKEDEKVPCGTTGGYVDMSKYHKLFTKG